jgi:hypothetical protein
MAKKDTTVKSGSAGCLIPAKKRINKSLLVPQAIADDPYKFSGWLSAKAEEVTKIIARQQGRSLTGSVGGHCMFRLPWGGVIMATPHALHDRVRECLAHIVTMPKVFGEQVASV